MAIHATTLSAAITASDTNFGLASTTYCTDPISTTGSGLTVLVVDNEVMAVVKVPASGQVQVLRGQNGTRAVSHAASCPVLTGSPSDFAGYTPAQSSTVPLQNKFQGVSAPVAAATSITPSGKVFHITGTTQTTDIVLPAGFVEGSFTVIPDAIWTWTTGGTAGTAIAVAGTVTAAYITVTFTYDAATGYWYPSRVA